MSVARRTLRDGDAYARAVDAQRPARARLSREQMLEWLDLIGDEIDDQETDARDAREMRERTRQEVDDVDAAMRALRTLRDVTWRGVGGR